MRFIPNNESVRQAMLAELGLADIEALFASIPREVRLGRELALPAGMAEEEQLGYFSGLAEANEGRTYTTFLGAGSYPHFVPLTIDSLIQRGEFFTSYTPYQPEVSQGILQAIFEFQTFITTLTGMEVANASMYDGASATAEAVLMAQRLTRGRPRVLLPQSLHPHYRAVTHTHTHFLDLTLETVPMDSASGRMDLAALEKALGPDVSAVVVQQPNAYGVVEDEAMSLALLATPGELGADLVVGEAQSFGVPVAFGGPYLGFMATRDAYKRQLPGRIVGETVDLEGRRGFVLTLATREQHIRREKATSNICTNQNLVMLWALIYLTLMGREGLRQVARDNVSLLAYFRERLGTLPGYALAYGGPSFNEVTVTCPRPAAQIVQACLKRGVVPGLDLARWDPALADKLLVAVTETKNRADIDRLIDALREVAS
jgi:glycine dehydrogenase subunit 1